MGDLGGFYLLAPLKNLTIRSCFPRDQPSTASCITFKVEGDSLRPHLSCRKESTTLLRHLRVSSRGEEHQFVTRLHLKA